MTLLSAFYVLCFTIFAVTVWGQTPAERVNPLLSSAEQEMRTRSKKRLYPGGVDEEPLKVQSQLISPTRKMGPATEAPPEDEPPAAEDQD